MTSPDPMSREELLELAPLDAFGILDEYEAALFNRSFHHASTAVQAEIRALQAQLAEDPNFLSHDEPRELLRQKVLIRIAEEVEETAEQLKPLATIGSNAVAATLLTQRVTASVEIPPSQDETMRELVAEIRSRASLTGRDRSTPYWRAAAFFLAAGLVVSLYFLASTMRFAEQIYQLASQRVIEEQLRSAVPDLTDFVYRGSELRALASVDSNVNATGTIIVNPESNEALLITFGLANEKGPYSLRSVDEQGNATVISSFAVEGPVGFTTAKIPAEFLARKFELLDSSGKVVLRSA